MASIMQTINEQVVSVAEYLVSHGKDIEIKVGDDVFVMTVRKKEDE